ncbi:MAG: hypothetical protein ACPG61_10305 [Paracoccaceae bacterium]
MVTYNVNVVHARAVIFGIKASVIKPPGKRPHVAVGGVCHVFCGNVPPDYSKSPDCHRLITAPCTVSDAFVLDERGALRSGVRVVHGDWLHQLALDEGFVNFADMQGHYDRMHGLPWSGQYVRWDARRADFRAQWPLIVKPPEVDADDTE